MIRSLRRGRVNENKNDVENLNPNVYILKQLKYKDIHQKFGFIKDTWCHPPVHLQHLKNVVKFWVFYKSLGLFLARYLSNFNIQ